MKSYEELKHIDFQHLWHPFTQTKVWFEDEPLIIERGEGVELVDVRGRRYLDGVSSLWCNVHGHGVAELTNALHEQVDALCHSTLLGLSHRPVIELTDRLIRLVPPNLTRVFYSDSGSAAVEAAIRICVEWWQKQESSQARKKKKLVSLYSGYHGDTLGSVGLGYLREFHQHISSIIVPSVKINPPHALRFYQGVPGDEAENVSLQTIRELFEREAEEIAAFVLEPMAQGAAGIWLQTPEFGAEVAKLCRQHNVLLVADEVATGFGKTGKMFACEHGPIAPDVLVMGKGLSAGYLPISAAAVTETLFQGFIGEPEELKTFFFGQTFCGNPCAAQVSAANLDYFAAHQILEKVPPRIEHLQRELRAKIEPLDHVFEVRSCGLMTGIELTKLPGQWVPYPANERAGIRIVQEARRLGAIIRPLGNVIVLMPALAMEEQQLSGLVEIAAAAIQGALGRP